MITHNNILLYSGSSNHFYHSILSSTLGSSLMRLNPKQYQAAERLVPHVLRGLSSNDTASLLSASRSENLSFFSLFFYSSSRGQDCCSLQLCSFWLPRFCGLCETSHTCATRSFCQILWTKIQLLKMKRVCFPGFYK